MCSNNLPSMAKKTKKQSMQTLNVHIILRILCALWKIRTHRLATSFECKEILVGGSGEPLAPRLKFSLDEKNK